MFEDWELLDELFRRGRLRSVEARHQVDPFSWDRYSQEPGYLDHVRKGLSRMTTDHLLQNGQFHFEMPQLGYDREFDHRRGRPYDMPRYGQTLEAKSDLWIITQPKHRRLGDGEIR
jgi:hypothetical protein